MPITPNTMKTSALLQYAGNRGALRAAMTTPPAQVGDGPTFPADADVDTAFQAVLDELDRRIPIP